MIMRTLVVMLCGAVVAMLDYLGVELHTFVRAATDLAEL
jgi:hypothetical protein